MKAIFEDYAGEITHEEYKELIAWLKAKKFSHLIFLSLSVGLKLRYKNRYNIYICTINTPTNLHKLTVFSQLLDELRAHTLSAQNRIIKSAGEEDLRLMLLNRYPLRLNEMPDTMAALIWEVEELLPDIKRIVEN